MKIFNEQISETIEHKILPSGLNYYIIPKKMYNEKRAVLTVKYGSIDSSYISGGQKFETPEGVAHFLEHKMFDNKSGSAFDNFSKLGSFVNAFTSFNNTAYYFSAESNYDENLKTLLDFVSEPYFTDETVQKEIGIIEQEISMYDDNPGWVVYFQMLDCLYENHPAKQNIAGTKNSIKEITKETLYGCYEKFYVPQNMSLICSGDLGGDGAQALAESYFGNSKSRVETLFPDERENVASEFKSQKMKISRPVFQIGFKDRNFKRQINRSCAVKMMLDLFIGESSELRKTLEDMQLLGDSLAFDYVYGEGYGYSTISGESKNPQALLEVIRKKADLIAREGFNVKDFERIKKKQMGRFIRGFNSVEAIAMAQTELATKNGTLFDCYNSYRNMRADDLNCLLKEHFREGGLALSVLTPE